MRISDWSSDVCSSDLELLDYAPEMAWLKPRVSGRSPWKVALSIATTGPRAANAGAAGTDVQPPTRLRLQSNLVGTRLTLPEPLDKPAAAALPTTVETTLPLGAGDIEEIGRAHV